MTIRRAPIDRLVITSSGREGLRDDTVRVRRRRSFASPRSGFPSAEPLPARYSRHLECLGRDFSKSSGKASKTWDAIQHAVSNSRKPTPFRTPTTETPNVPMSTGNPECGELLQRRLHTGPEAVEASLSLRPAADDRYTSATDQLPTAGHALGSRHSASELDDPSSRNGGPSRRQHLRSGTRSASAAIAGRSPFTGHSARWPRDAYG
ncbi:MAG: hypothetical protein EOP24_34860 [Hyphomicrobiales bacterium]|nr:MAG: hypothetical protein EOP24_34860 [Hyphomicrobiales bacterium]